MQSGCAHAQVMWIAGFLLSASPHTYTFWLHFTIPTEINSFKEMWVKGCKFEHLVMLWQIEVPVQQHKGSGALVQWDEPKYYSWNGWSRAVLQRHPRTISFSMPCIHDDDKQLLPEHIWAFQCNLEVHMLKWCGLLDVLEVSASIPTASTCISPFLQSSTASQSWDWMVASLSIW